MRRKTTLDKVKSYIGQKWQALTRPVHETGDINTAINFLDTHPNHGMALSLTPQQIKDINDAVQGYEDALILNENKVPRGIEATCQEGHEAQIKRERAYSGPCVEKLIEAEKNLIEQFRAVMEPLFEGHQYKAAYLDGFRPIMHNHKGHNGSPDAFRFVTYRLGEQPTVFPTFTGKTQSASKDAMLCFGPGFYHSPPEEEHPILLANCTID